MEAPPMTAASYQSTLQQTSGSFEDRFNSKLKAGESDASE